MRPGQRTTDKKIRVPTLLFRLVTVVAVLMGMVPVAELAVRLILPEYRALTTDRAMWVHDTELGWITRANYVGEQSLPGGERVTVRTNRLGFRDAEIPEPRDPWRYRIVVLGDSFAFGYGVPVEARIGEVLTRLADGRLETINLGVTGYSTDQELLLWRRFGVPLAPDAVVLMYTGNDPRGNALAVGFGHPKPVFRLRDERLELQNVPVPRSGAVLRLKYALARHSALYNLLRERLGATLRWTGVNRLVLDERIAGDGGPGVERSVAAREITRRLILEFVKEVRAVGARPIVLICTPGPALAATIAENSVLFAWCRDLRIECLDTAPGFRSRELAEPEVQLFQADQHHWTAEGHGLAARLLFEAIGPLGRAN